MMPFIGRMMQAGVNPKKLIFVGLTTLMICLFVMATFSSFSSKSDILISLYLRGFGLAFLFVPINSSILSQFHGAELGQVSGLLNLFRQIGGSLGIALIATLFAVKSQQNFLDMTSQVTLLRPTVYQQYTQMTNGMKGKMTEEVGFGKPSEVALKSIYYRMQNQVFVQSFLQLLWTMMFAFILSYIPLYFIRLGKGPVQVVNDH